jgi:hypothetical protein
MQDLQFSKLTSMIGKRGMQVHALIQTAAIQAVLCSIEDRQPQRANQLLASINIGQRKDTLVAYLERFGNLAWLKNEKKFGFFDAKRVWTPEYANEVAGFDWAKAKKEPDIKSVYDVTDMLDKLIEGAHRAVKTGKEIIGSDVLSELESVCYRMRAKKYEDEAKRLAAAPNKSDTENHKVPQPDANGDMPNLREILAGKMEAEAPRMIHLLA